jgi:8-oxo-dGTP pyrophosphatase MutT (NUDIX family)
MITRRGAMTVVLSEDRQKVLLLRREVFVLWDLPGGGIEQDEAPEAAAVRECREETGFEIEIERYMGQYLHQSIYGRGDQLTHAFRAHIIGGASRPSYLETTGMRWCALGDLPRGVQALQRQMILDATSSDADPIDRRLDFPLWKLYPARIIFYFVRWRNYIIRWILGRSGYYDRNNPSRSH